MRKLIVSSTLFLTILAASCTKTQDSDPQPGPSNTAANWTDSLQRNLWAYFPFNAGSLSDASGNSHHLRAENGIISGADRGGAANSALAFDGVNDYVVCDSGTVFPAGNFAISFAVNAASTTSGRIFNKANLNTALGASFVLGFEPQFQSNVVFSVTKDPNICSSFSDLSNSNAIPSFRPLAPNQWYNVVAQFNNGVQSLYINGQLVSAMYTPNATFSVCPNAPIYFGIWWLQDLRAFGGRLDNIRIYTRALQEDEIRYLNVNNL
jgi:hypothetical protein